VPEVAHTQSLLPSQPQLSQLQFLQLHLGLSQDIK
jgi:hypothetical protein